MSMNTPDPTAEDLRHDPAEARKLWEKVAKAYGLHNELAVLYRAGGRDTRTINVLWEQIEVLEAELRQEGVHL